MWIQKSKDACLLAKINTRNVHILTSGLKWIKNLAIVSLYLCPHFFKSIHKKRTYYSKILNCFIWLCNCKIFRSPSIWNKYKYVVKPKNSVLFLIFPLPISLYSEMARTCLWHITLSPWKCRWWCGKISFKQYFLRGSERQEEGFVNIKGRIIVNSLFA